MTYPKVDPELIDLVRNIYSRWTAEEFGNAIWQYRREHNLIVERQSKKQQIQQLTASLEALDDNDTDA